MKYTIRGAYVLIHLVTILEFLAHTPRAGKVSPATEIKTLTPDDATPYKFHQNANIQVLSRPSDTPSTLFD